MDSTIDFIKEKKLNKQQKSVRFTRDKNKEAHNSFLQNMIREQDRQTSLTTAIMIELNKREVTDNTELIGSLYVTPSGLNQGDVYTNTTEQIEGRLAALVVSRQVLKLGKFWALPPDNFKLYEVSTWGLPSHYKRVKTPEGEVEYHFTLKIPCDCPDSLTHASVHYLTRWFASKLERIKTDTKIDQLIEYIETFPLPLSHRKQLGYLVMERRTQLTRLRAKLSKKRTR